MVTFNKEIIMCNQTVEQVIPTNIDYKTVSIKCGMTGYYGETVLCDCCKDKKQLTYADMYESNWDY